MILEQANTLDKDLTGNRQIAKETNYYNDFDRFILRRLSGVQSYKFYYEIPINKDFYLPARKLERTRSLTLLTHISSQWSLERLTRCL